MRILLVFIPIFLRVTVSAQSPPEDKNLLHYFSNGELSGQIRDFTMSTINAGELDDYYANAIGASIHYETLPFKGFSVALNGIFVYRVFSNDVLAIDTIAQDHSQYELQLFNIKDKGNFSDLDRLEELYVKYEREKLAFTYGKMEIESPLVRLHDGRMKPKVFSGFKTNVSLHSHNITGAWFTKASPRSTTHWYPVAHAIGIYSNGFTTEGDEAHYHDQISSAGLGILGLDMKLNKNTNINAWNYYLDNISNSTLIKVDITKDTGVYGGFMYLYQRPINSGGNIDPRYTFHQSTERTNLLSGSLGYHFGFCDVKANATHILNSGRFLFPREFGVDPSYTYISRSQIEGQGNATSFGITWLKNIKNIEVKLDWNRMLTDNRALYNKYMLPSYDQFNLDCFYGFEDKLDGLELRLLYVYRRSTDRDIVLSKQHNTVNFNQINVVANFNFAMQRNHHNLSH